MGSAEVGVVTASLSAVWGVVERGVGEFWTGRTCLWVGRELEKCPISPPLPPLPPYVAPLSLSFFLSSPPLPSVPFPPLPSPSPLLLRLPPSSALPPPPPSPPLLPSPPFPSPQVSVLTDQIRQEQDSVHELEEALKARGERPQSPELDDLRSHVERDQDEICTLKQQIMEKDTRVRY